MRKRLKQIIVVLALAAVAWLALLWSELLPRPTAAQREALALMEAAAPVPGKHNAFEFFWWAAYDIAPAEREAALQADIDALQQWQPDNWQVQFHAPSRDRHARLIELDDEALQLCDPHGECLDRLAADTGKAASLLLRHASLLRRLDGISALDHWNTPFAADIAAPTPSDLILRQLRWSDLGLRFLSGDRESALAGVCGDTLAWRRLRRHSDSLIASLIAQRSILGSLRLYADMRSRLPADADLPSECLALQSAPDPDERMGCEVFRGEFRMVGQWLQPEGDLPSNRLLHLQDDSWQRASSSLMLNRAHTTHLLAERHANACHRASAPTTAWPGMQLPGRSCSRFAALFNPMGCTLEDIARPADYGSYILSDRDVEGALRLVALADWLARQDDPQAALASPSEARRDFEHEFALEDQQLVLTRLGHYGPDRQQWRIPLPGSRAGQASDTGRQLQGD